MESANRTEWNLRIEHNGICVDFRKGVNGDLSKTRYPEATSEYERHNYDKIITSYHIIVTKLKRQINV